MLHSNDFFNGLLTLVAWSMVAPIGRCDDPLFLFFHENSSLQPLNTTLVNPNTGDEEVINGTFNVSSNVWKGGGSDQDVLFLTSLSDALMLTNALGQQMVMDIEFLLGSGGADKIILADANLDYNIDTHITGGGGDDLIWANIGNDTIDGGSGNDTINGGPGNDIIHGDSNNDKLNGAQGIDQLFGGDDQDVLYFSVDNTWSAFEGGQNVRFVTRNAGDPSNPITNGARVSVSTSNQSHDLFDGGDGVDLFNLTDGNDAVFLHDPYSPFSGDPNAARIVDIEFIDTKGGDDIVDLTSPLLSYGDVTILGGSGDDVLWSSSGSDALFGDDGNDHLDGNSGDDQLEGGDGDDILYGRSGNDFMNGDAGSNIIHMGEDSDFVVASAGNDTLIYDTFDAIVDFISGFEVSGAGADILDISNILTGYDPLTDAIENFVALGDDQGNTLLLINQDGDAGGAFTVTAVFDSNLNTTVADLINGGSLLTELTVEIILDADFDQDGRVSGADFLAWQRGFGQASGATLSTGDANGDGAVDAADLSIWQDQLGTIYIHGPGGAPSAAATVPEPSSLVLALLLPICLLWRRRAGSQANCKVRFLNRQERQGNVGEG